MKTGQAGLGAFLTLALAASISWAAPADSGARVEAVSAPAGTDAQLKAALRESVRQHLAETQLSGALAGYSISPSLIQLRRYVGPAPGRVKLVCIVGLALSSERGVVANVRGNSTTVDASPIEALDAAAHAAVRRLPGALAQLESGPKPVAAR